jgi:hypothetical protein
MLFSPSIYGFLKVDEFFVLGYRLEFYLSYLNSLIFKKQLLSDQIGIEFLTVFYCNNELFLMFLGREVVRKLTSLFLFWKEFTYFLLYLISFKNTFMLNEPFASFKDC